MGMFSWIDVNCKENIVMEDEKVILLIPKEHRDVVEKVFGITLTDRGIEGSYDGYGCIHGIDVYDVCAFLNVCCTTDKQFKEIVIRKYINPNMQLCAENIRNLYKEGKANSIKDFYSICIDYPNMEFRYIGIDIGCYDLQNALLPYPIKITLDDYHIYENSQFSMRDLEQGFYKYGGEKLKETAIVRDAIASEVSMIRR